MYIIFSIIFFLLLNAYSNKNITSRELAINVLIFTATLLFIRLIRYRFIPAITHRKTNIGGCKGTRYGCCPDGVKPCLDSTCSNCQKLVGGCKGTQYGCCPDGKTACIDRDCGNC